MTTFTQPYIGRSQQESRGVHAEAITAAGIGELTGPQYARCVLHGRHAELAAIDDVLRGAGQELAGALVVRGEAGIGKSALLAYAAERADDLRVLRVVGVESEAEFAFAALHRLLWPLRNDIEGLPGPQAAALCGAFGMAPAPVEGPDRFLVMVAVLTLLAEAAERQPLLCLVDDAQWVDRSSADALLFVARRLAAERIAMLFAARDGDGQTFAAPGIPELHVGGLDAEAAAALLAERHPGRLDPRVTEDLIKRTGGNPLALLEVPALLQPPQLAGRTPLPEVLPIGRGMERAFLTRVRRLSPVAQTLLDVAAAEDSAELAAVLRAAATLGAGADAVEEVDQAGLATVVGDRIEFGHPLVRSALYRSMTFARRRAVHRALVDSLGPDATDRRAWHLAAATNGPDESVATALEDSADRARSRSGHAAAATALHRAAELSGDAEAKSRRLIRAADSAWLAGQALRSQSLVDQAASLATGAREQVAVAYLRGLFQFRGGIPVRAADILIDGASQAASHDPRRALEMLMVAADAAGLAGDTPRLIDIGRRAAMLPTPDNDHARFTVHLLTGVSDVLQGNTVRGAERLAAADTLAEAFDDPRYLLWAAVTELYLGRGDSTQRVPRAVARARALGAVGVLPFALEISALGAARAGYVSEAVTQASEGLRLACDIGQQAAAGNLLAALAMAAALQGREQDCRRYAEEALAEATSRCLGLVTGVAHHALAVLDLGLGRPVEALERLLAIASAGPGAGHPLVALVSAVDLVEAAVRAGRRDVADQAVEDFARRSRGVGPSQNAMLAYCRGLLGDSDAAKAHFEEALRLFAIPMPFWRARIELGYGEQLRRARQRSAARSYLRAALETFERLTITPWAERARAELRASGETVRERDFSAVNQLTPQELQIARFASQGASNPEIAAQLFLSRRTVEYHLGKVFQKLGVRSRTELAVLHLG